MSLFCFRRYLFILSAFSFLIVIARILGANVNAIRDFVLAKLKNQEYFKTIRQKILDVIETKSIDEFAENLGLSSAETWEVYRQIKEMIMDSEILRMITQVSNITTDLETIVSTKLQNFRNTLDEQLKKESMSKILFILQHHRNLAAASDGVI